MAKHTPGPREAEDNSIIATFEGEEAQVAIVARTSWGYPDGGKNKRFRSHKEADARLIAAAPQLLEALEMAVEAIANSDAKFCMAAIDRAYAAIEAARVK